MICYNFKVHILKIALVLNIREQVAGVFRPGTSVVQVNPSTPQVYKLVAPLFKVFYCLDKCIKGFAAAADADEL